MTTAFTPGVFRLTATFFHLYPANIGSIGYEAIAKKRIDDIDERADHRHRRVPGPKRSVIACILAMAVGVAPRPKTAVTRRQHRRIVVFPHHAPVTKIAYSAMKMVATLTRIASIGSASDASSHSFRLISAIAGNGSKLTFPSTGNSALKCTDKTTSAEAIA